jgi:uncharacterized protein
MTLLLGVLIASLLGSVHCAAMCSVFACAAHRGQRAHGFYHGGRLVGYAILGVSAGLFGSQLDRAGLLLDLQRAAVFVTATALILWGVVRLRAARPSQQRVTTTVWGRALGALITRTDSWQPRPRAAGIGLVTSLLPCGWLWAFVATAMGTGSPLAGATVMFVFWIGTVPLLLAATAGVKRWGPLAQVRWPLASASLVIVLGVAQLLTHLLMPSMPTGNSMVTQNTHLMH